MKSASHLRFIHWNSHIITWNVVSSVKWAFGNSLDDTWINWKKNMLHLNISGAKWRPFRLGQRKLSFNGLTTTRWMGDISWDCWPITCNRRLSIRSISPVWRYNHQHHRGHPATIVNVFKYYHTYIHSLPDDQIHCQVWQVVSYCMWTCIFVEAVLY